MQKNTTSLSISLKKKKSFSQPSTLPPMKAKHTLFSNSGPTLCLAYLEAAIAKYKSSVIAVKIKELNRQCPIKVPENPVNYIENNNSKNNKNCVRRPVYTGDFCRRNSMQFLSRRSCSQLRFHCDFSFSTICQCKRPYTSIP